MVKKPRKVVDTVRMLRQRGRVARLVAGEDGFTIIESMAAAIILIIAIVLTITPLTASMRLIDRSKEVTVAENLAQARVEEIRSLDYDDVGNPGYAPDGILTRTYTQDVEGRTYTVNTDVQYVGAATGLNVIAQGGDGVQGSFDPGVNYKYVTVEVTSETGAIDAVRMDSIVAPPTVGALEEVAVVTVLIDEHEPYDPYPDAPPILQLQGALNYLSMSTGESQPFPAVQPGTYDIVLFSANNWQLHPDTITSGANTVSAVAGWNSTRTLRVYQPASLTVDVIDDVTLAPITTATVLIESQASGASVTNPPGDYAFVYLIPDRFSVTVTAPGYVGNQIDVDVPGFGGGNSATTTVALSAIPTTTTTTTIPPPTTTTLPTGSTTTTLPPTTTTTVGSGFVNVSFFVGYFDLVSFADYYIHDALINVSHPLYGSWSGRTDATGNVSFTLPANETGFAYTAETEHGHGPVTQTFTTGGAAFTVTSVLGKPTATDRYAITAAPAGPGGYAEYRIDTYRRGRWRRGQVSRLPMNDLGNASFLVTEQSGTRRVRIWAYCAGGSRYDMATYTLDDNNHTWSPTGSCP